MQNLHLADNSNLDKEDKFAKVRPLIDELNEQCFANSLPEQSVSIDESMVPYLRRHGCKQYMRNKVIVARNGGGQFSVFVWIYQ